VSVGRIVVVTGTDTGVGKTIVTAAIACCASASGTVAVYKPVQTGTEIGDSDIAEVTRLGAVTSAVVGSEQPEPLAPTTAARRAGRTLPSLHDHLSAMAHLAKRYDTVLVEGAGGVLVALTDEGEGVAELARHSGAVTVVVARSGLGTLNHTALTAEALRARKCPVAGVVIGSWPNDPDLATRCNLDDLPVATGLPVVGRVPEDAAALTPDEFGRRAPEWIDGSGWLS
jgi:dethiobiotin synthetase